MFAGLLSAEAHALYERLIASGGLPGAALGDPAPADPALAELTAHGLVWEAPGPPRRVRAVSRPVALRRVLGRRQRELAEAHRQLADHYTWLDRLTADGPAAAPASAGVEVVHSPDAVLAAHHDLLAGARECRLLRAAPAPGWPAAPVTTVPVRTVRTPAAPAVDGPDCRVLTELPLTMTLIDEVALVPAGPAGETALLIRAPALVGGLGQYFELLWAAAAPVVAACAADDGPAPIQREILRLAGQGLKDDAIARSLGRSSRWVRRHIEVLEERLGATNRFTLGVAAARRGWV